MRAEKFRPLIVPPRGRLKERYPRAARYYEMDYEAEAKKLSHQENTAAQAKAERWDGGYLIRTDRADIAPDELR